MRVGVYVPNRMAHEALKPGLKPLTCFRLKGLLIYPKCTKSGTQEIRKGATFPAFLSSKFKKFALRSN